VKAKNRDIDLTSLCHDSEQSAIMAISTITMYPKLSLPVDPDVVLIYCRTLRPPSHVVALPQP